MEIHENPFASPRAAAGKQFVDEDGGVGQFSWRATDILRKTRPWVRFLGILAVLLGVFYAGIAAMNITDLLPADDVAERIGNLMVNVLGAGFYLLTGVLLLVHTHRITQHLDDRDEASMIAALHAHRILLKAMSCFVLMGLVLVVLAFAVVIVMP